jgi:hypothetical protein
VSGSERTAWEEAASGMERVKAAEEALAAAEAALASGDGDATRAAEELARATETYNAVGGPGKDFGARTRETEAHTHERARDGMRV